MCRPNPFALPKWNGKTVVILASGPSLSDRQLSVAEAARAKGKCRVLAVNNTWERAPWADALYACDDNWWEQYAPAFKGERWTQSPRWREFGVKWIEGQRGYDLSLGPHIHTGGNSGFQAINFAFLAGARRIVLAGFDMQTTGGKLHWHPDHGGKCHNPPRSQFEPWARNVDRLAVELARHGCEPVNATEQTALKLWPRMDIGEALDT